MDYDCHSGKAVDLKIAYVGGGSRAWANVLMTDLALEESLSGTVCLYDIDYAAACENALVGNRVTSRPEAKGKWKYTAVETLKEALTGADFVVISILPGTFKEMHSDVHAPEKYGVYQSVGDSTGPGGMVRALRTIPMFREFAENIRQFCPEAWVVNYTNPMSACIRTLYKFFPGIRAFGCCHEVFDTQLDVADMLKASHGIAGATTRDIRVNVLGINHFTWIDRISFKGIDLMGLYADTARKHRDTGYEREVNKQWRNSVFRCTNRVKFDLFNRYGLIAAAGDRHLAEFMPPWYLKDAETVEKWGFALTTVDWRIKDRERVNERRRNILSGECEFPLLPTGEEGVLMMKALLGLGDYVTNVNLPNHNQMDEIPQGAVVETNALFSKGNVSPVYAGKLPDDVQNLVIRHVYNQECIVEAALRTDEKLAFNAFVNDPLMARVDAEDAKNLFAEMISNTIDYLPGWEKSILPGGNHHEWGFS